MYTHGSTTALLPTMSIFYEMWEDLWVWIQPLPYLLVILLIESNIYTLIIIIRPYYVLSSTREQCAVHLLTKSNPKFLYVNVLAPTETDIPKFAKFTYILLQEHLAMQFYWLQTNLFSSQICFLGTSWWFEYQCEFC